MGCRTFPRHDMLFYLTFIGPTLSSTLIVWSNSQTDIKVGSKSHPPIFRESQTHRRSLATHQKKRYHAEPQLLFRFYAARENMPPLTLPPVVHHLTEAPEHQTLGRQVPVAVEKQRCTFSHTGFRDRVFQNGLPLSVWQRN